MIRAGPISVLWKGECCGSEVGIGHIEDFVIHSVWSCCV